MSLDISAVSQRKRVVINKDVTNSEKNEIDNEKELQTSPEPEMNDMSYFIDESDDKDDIDIDDTDDTEGKSDDIEEKESLDEEEPEVIKAESVEIYTPPLTDEDLKGMGSMENIRYKSGDVAKMLGISDQVVRNYAEQYDSILHVEKTATGHRRFSEENIEQLKLIIQLKHERGLTTEQTIEFFQSQDKPLSSLTTEMKFDVLLQLISERVNTAVTAALENHISIEKNQQLLIEQYDRSLEDNSNLIEALTEIIEKQNEQIENQRLIIEDMKRLNEDTSIKQQENIAELNRMMTELMEKDKGKKGIFGLFK